MLIWRGVEIELKLLLKYVCVCVAHLFPSSVCQEALKKMMPEGQQACSSVLASKPMFFYKKNEESCFHHWGRFKKIILSEGKEVPQKWWGYMKKVKELTCPAGQTWNNLKRPINDGNWVTITHAMK